MRIAEIEAFGLELPFTDAVDPFMRRALTHQGTVTVYRVRLEGGQVGYGDMVGAPLDASEWVGADAVRALKACRHGGVQMACYDAVGKALGVPAHVLMGRQVRPRVPFAYWTIDLSPDVFAGEVKRAAALGYTTYKFKGRPWFDPIEQIEAVAKVAPPGFRVWIDFNGHLREARLALPILKKLSMYDVVGGFESPIPQRDVEGTIELRRKIDKPIALHFATGCCHVANESAWDPGVTAEQQLRLDLGSGYVLGGMDVDEQRALGALCHEFRRPFWIQLVGTALRAAWVAHLVSTLDEALLSSLTAHDLWARDVARAPRPIDGWLPVPTGPGLGIEVDEGSLRALVSPPRPRPRTISTVVYPSGVRWSFGAELQRHEAFYYGHLPGFVPGVRLEHQVDDGSKEFDALHQRCLTAPTVE